jgi:hypothetical protein
MNSKQEEQRRKLPDIQTKVKKISAEVADAQKEIDELVEMWLGEDWSYV